MDQHVERSIKFYMENIPGLSRQDAELKSMLFSYEKLVENKAKVYRTPLGYFVKHDNEDSSPPEGAVETTYDEFYFALIKERIIAGLRRNIWQMHRTKDGTTLINTIYDIDFDENELIDVVPKQEAIRFFVLDGKVE